MLTERKEARDRGKDRDEVGGANMNDTERSWLEWKKMTCKVADQAHIQVKQDMGN